MQVELGPVAATDVERWIRFARRLMAEVRMAPMDLEGIVSDDLVNGWTALIDRWADRAAEGGSFRWSGALDCEQADYLLHGLRRSIGSNAVCAHVTDDEMLAHRAFTTHVVEAFTSGLETEGTCYEQHAAQIRATLLRTS